MDDLIVLFINPNVRKRVKKFRIDNNKDPNKDNIHDYPAAVVLGCVKEHLLPKNTIPSFYYGESANEEISFTYCNSKLIKAFDAIGGLWKKNSDCHNLIGNCAEQHLAEAFLNDNTDCCLHDIEFSTAFRPRTDVAIPYCSNCLSLFL